MCDETHGKCPSRNGLFPLTLCCCGILSSEYLLYASGKIFLAPRFRAKIFINGQTLVRCNTSDTLQISNGKPVIVDTSRKKKRSLIGVIQLSTCLLISLLVIALGSLWLHERIKHSQLHVEEICESYLSSSKESIKQDVDNIGIFIEYSRDELEKRVKANLRQRTEEAYQIAQYIYEQNREVLNLREIGTLVHDALYAASWNDGRGYYFAEDMAGVEQINRNNPELEGQSIINIQDSNGKYIVKEILAVARSEKQEGFCSYYWNRPEYPKKIPKISYVKYFPPLDWVIGNGVYLQDEEDKIKQEIIKRIENTTLPNGRYMFVGTWEGNILTGPGKGKNMWDVSDTNGLKIVQELIGKAKSGGGFVSYVMPRLEGQRSDSKISYSAPVPEWNWYIGTGMYVDFIEDDIARQQESFSKATRKFTIQALLVIAMFLFVSYFLVWLFSRKIKKNFDLFMDFFKKSASEQLAIEHEKVSFHEFESLALLANHMVEDRQNAEEKKETSEERFRRILENITDVYFESELDGSITYCSPSCLELSGYSPKDLINKNINILCNNPKDLDLLLTPIKNEGKVHSLELIFENKNGDLYEVSINAELTFDKHGNHAKIKGTLRDVTATNMAKEQLHRSKKMEAIGLMAGGVAHDLNNTLSGIIGYPELLLQTLPKDSELRKPLEAILESGQRAATVVADLLTVARGAASIREHHNLNNLIQGHIGSLECEHVRDSYPDVSYQCNFNALQPTISCSPVHVKKCLINLVINGAESMVSSGTVTVSTYNKFVDKAMALTLKIKVGEYIILSVRDTGTGISDTDLKHIFEPFYTKKTMGKSGTGLGLAVVWNTMEDHKGKVLVESSEEGTCFHLYFPVSKDRKTTEEKPHKPIVSSSNAEHILVVDDEPQLRDIASQALSSFGYHVDSVDSGESAIEFVKKEPVDLLLMDMLMEPGINGCETYKEILKLYPEQKAIVVSGFSESDDVKTTLRLGAGGFIKKPYSIDQLGRMVKEVLNS